MWYVFGIGMVLLVFGAVFGFALRTGLLAPRPHAQPLDENPYLLKAPVATVEPSPSVQRHRGSKTLIVNRPRQHERIVNRETTVLSDDDHLSAVLDDWRRDQGDL